MTTEEIKKIIKDFLDKIGVSIDSIEIAQENGRECYQIRSRDSHLLIGSKGAHLFAINHIIRKIVAKSEQERQFSIDVNNYQSSAVEHLKDMAKIMGERARSFKTSVELEPMSSYERMVVHSFFEGEKDLITESVGAGENRRVIIKYKED